MRPTPDDLHRAHQALRHGEVCLDEFMGFLGLSGDAPAPPGGPPPMNVTASRENGRSRPKGYADWNPHKATRVLLAQVIAVLREYEDHLPLTIRQVFYRLVGAYGYEKTEQAYARLCDHLTRARRARIIPFECLRDDGVSVMADRCYGSVADFWDYVADEARRFKRDKQDGQRYYVELWCEAQGMQPQLHAVAREYNVPVYSPGGFASVTAVRAIVDRAVTRDVPTVILHVGDHDPSGESISARIATDAREFLIEDALLPGVHHLIPERVALTREQVEEYDLPTAPPKKTDSRSKRWEGETCQVEALPPDTLADLVREAIEEWLDPKVLGRHRVDERAERTALLRALPSGDDEDEGRTS